MAFPLFLVKSHFEVKMKDALRPRFAGGGHAASVASLMRGDFFN